ncbi:hypothetical protein PAEPH01_1136 [Pancytospora epiphaga]|nr:hypothetical protein PAEPH01_1136 [Pancytospora epiphaga]
MLSLKEKLKILDAVNSKAFSYSRMPEYLDYTADPSLIKPLLKRIFSCLVLLDTEISASHDILEDDDWDSLFNIYDTPLSADLAKLKTDITLFTSVFNTFYQILFSKCNIEDIFDIITPLFKNKTRNIQFLLFKLPVPGRSKLFGFLLARLRKEPRVYAPFYCSLIARWAIGDDLKNRCIGAYMRYFQSLTLTKSLDCTVSAQYLLYLFCFNREYFNSSEEAKGAVCKIFSLGLHKGMNEGVLEKFCGLYGYKYSNGTCNVPECLNFFPFDWPICKDIQELIADEYIQYS